MATKSMIEMDQRLKAGREYLGALKKLGFNPEALLWATASEQIENERFELLVVTSWADNIGPKAIYDLLFEAYDLSATPKEIDPFVVSIFSPQTQVAKDIEGSMRTFDIEFKRSPKARPMFILGMMDYATIPEWIIWYRPQKSTRFDDVRRFAAFQRNVEALAA